MSRTRWVLVQIKEILSETDLAFRVEIVNEDRNRMWIPKSVIRDVEQFNVEDEDVEMYVEDWFAQKEDLE